MLRRILITTGYTLLTALVVAATFLLVAYGQGYSYDFKTGRLFRTGLVIIQSVPSGIKVAVDGKKLNKKTTYQKLYEAGHSYVFELAKDGYNPWHKALNVVASEVTLVQYAILVPKNPVVNILDTRQITSQSMSKDHHHLAYIASGKDGGVYVVDPSNAKPVRIYIPKEAAAPQPAEEVTDISWSDDASHLIVTSKMGPATTYHVITSSGDNAVNLTDQFHVDLAGIKFSGNNSKQLYWISPEGLRRVDLDTKEISKPIAENVVQFSVAGDRVLYVQQTSIGRTLWSTDGHGKTDKLVEALPQSASYSLAFTSYRGKDQLAVVPSDTHTGTLYSDVYSDTPVATTIAHDVTTTSFSPDGHLLVFTGPGMAITYDLERVALTGKFTTYTFPGVVNLKSLTWFDNFHVLTNQNGHLVWSEFDGANRLDLNDYIGSFPAYSSADMKSIVALRVDSPVSTRILQIVIK